VQALVVLSIAWVAYGVYITLNAYTTLQKKTITLSYLANYQDAKSSIRGSVGSANSDQKNQFIKDLQSKETIYDVIKLNAYAEWQHIQTKKYFDSIQYPYVHLLQYFLLPPMNIWKNRFTGKIDDTLVWQKYLQWNEYLDVNLIAKWTDFFKDIGRDSPKNEIKNIQISDVQETDGGVFMIPISLSFVAETKRSFLLLVDKLSVTSNRENLGLMNEFFSHLWAVLKEKDPTMIGTGGNAPTFTGNIDEYIGASIYKWVIDPNSKYITEQDVFNTIRRAANCESDPADACLFKFRQKMRSIPLIAYTIGAANTNKVTELRLFLNNLPPLMNVKQFTFTRKSATANKDGNKVYEWNLTVEAYGKSMTPTEVDQIAVYLWWICTDNIPLSPAVALWQLEKTIKQATQITQISNEKSKQLNDLRKAIEDINLTYSTLGWFKRTIKLFEVYRMLFDNRLCSRK